MTRLVRTVDCLWRQGPSRISPGSTSRRSANVQLLGTLAQCFRATVISSCKNPFIGCLDAFVLNYSHRLKPDGSILSFGPGLERETVHAGLNLWLNDAGRWCIQTDEDRLSLAISMPLAMASTISRGRLEGFRVFGALVALSLISGKPPGNLSPALLQYALNDCNLDALTPSFVASFNPAIERAARSMQAIGPNGDLALFQSFIINVLNIQVHVGNIHLTCH